MRRLAALLSLLLAVAAAASAGAQGYPPGFVGRVNKVALGAERLFVFASTEAPNGDNYRPGVRVLDVADPARPRPAGFIPGLIAFNIAAAGTRAYVTDGGGGLHVVDATDPERPFEVGAYHSPALLSRQPYGIAVAGNHAYVVEEEFGAGVRFSTGIRAVDATDPARPAATWFAAGSAYALAVDGGVLYALDVAPDEQSSAGFPARLVTYSLADPRQPVEIGSTALASRSGFSTFPLAIAAGGGRVYLASPSQVGRTAPDARTRIVVLDVSDPRAAVQRAELVVEQATVRLALTGTRLYLSQYAAGVRAIDVADPAAPTVLGSLALPGLSADALAAGGETVYAGQMPDPGGGRTPDFVPPEKPALAVLDFALPASPRQIGAYNPASRALLTLAPRRAVP
jgi:hypothetical protein